MILRLYRSNQPLVLFFLPLFALLFWISAFFHNSPVPPQFLSGPLFDLLIYATGGFVWIQTLIGLSLVVINAILLNNIYNDFNFTDRANYLPSLIYVFFSSFTPEFCQLHPGLPGLLFLIIALRRIMAMYRQSFAGSETFDAGLYLGIATLFYPALWIVLPAIWVSLLILRAFHWREWLLPLLGIAVAFGLSEGLLYLFGIHSNWTHLFSYKAWSFPTAEEYSTSAYWMILFLTLLLAFGGVYRFVQSLSATTMHRRNLKQVFLVVSVFLIFAYINAAFLDQQAYQASLLAIPFAVWIAFYVHQSKRQWLAAFLFYAWLIFAVLFYYI